MKNAGYAGKGKDFKGFYSHHQCDILRVGISA